MYLPNYYSSYLLAQQKVEDCAQRAERRRMLRQAGVDQRGWLALGACKLLSRVGCLLVALGRRLERAARPPMAPSARLPRVSGA
jgi:hypothetical protein